MERYPFHPSIEIFFGPNAVAMEQLQQVCTAQLLLGGREENKYSVHWEL